MIRPVVEVSRDLSDDGVVLTTTEKWSVEDACESVARAISPKAFVALAVALDEFDKNNPDSVVALYQARDVISREAAGKSLVLARMLPHEVIGLIKALTNSLEKSA